MLIEWTIFLKKILILTHNAFFRRRSAHRTEPALRQARADYPLIEQWWEHLLSILVDPCKIFPSLLEYFFEESCSNSFFFHFTFAHHSNFLGLNCSEAVKTTHDPTATWWISEASTPDALLKYDTWKYLFSSAFHTPHTHTTSLSSPSNASACHPALFSNLTSKGTLLQTHLWSFVSTCSPWISGAALSDSMDISWISTS